MPGDLGKLAREHKAHELAATGATQKHFQSTSWTWREREREIECGRRVEIAGKLLPTTSDPRQWSVEGPPPTRALCKLVRLSLLLVVIVFAFVACLFFLFPDYQRPTFINNFPSKPNSQSVSCFLALLMNSFVPLPSGWQNVVRALHVCPSPCPRH